MQRIELAVAALILLAGCRGPTFQQRAQGINLGDPKSKVIEIMGPAENRQMYMDREVLQYANTSMNGCQYTAVWIKAGRVVAVTSYYAPVAPNCEAGFKTVNWENTPDFTLGVKVQ